MKKVYFSMFVAVITLMPTLLCHTRKNCLTDVMSDNIEALTESPELNNGSCSGVNISGYQLLYFEEEIEQYVASYTGTYRVFNEEFPITLGIIYYLRFRGYRCEPVSDLSACCNTMEQWVTDSYQIAINF